LSLEQTSEMTSTDREALAKAVKSLEYPSLAARLTNLVGKPVELIEYAMPRSLLRFLGLRKIAFCVIASE
jgi:hypothetical protein